MKGTRFGISYDMPCFCEAPQDWILEDIPIQSFSSQKWASGQFGLDPGLTFTGSRIWILPRKNRTGPSGLNFSLTGIDPGLNLASQKRVYRNIGI